ncbi:MAG: hypothetical protein R2912_09080 [Eubacteriales bacterium]
METITTNFDELIIKAADSFKSVGEAVKVLDALDMQSLNATIAELKTGVASFSKLDIETLNEAIANLNATVEPLARFSARNNLNHLRAIYARFVIRSIAFHKRKIADYHPLWRNLSILIALFATSGTVSRFLFSREKPLVRIWLGLALGMAMFIWFPALFSFLLGLIYPRSYRLTAGLSCRGAAGFYFSAKNRLSLLLESGSAVFRCGRHTVDRLSRSSSTHTIVPARRRALCWTPIYGDLAMHSA